MEIAVNSFSVQDQTTYEQGAELLKSVNTAIKKVDALLDPPCKNAYAAWQATLAHKKVYLTPLETAKKTITNKLSVYATEMEKRRKAAEEEARLEAERLENEQKDRLIAEAEAATETGNIEKAEEKFMEAATTFVAPAVAAVGLGKVAGTALTDEYEIDVTNIKLFLKEVVEGRVRLDLNELVTLKMGVLKTYVKTTKHMDIPGLKIRVTKKVKGTGA